MSAFLTPTDMDNTNTLKHILIISTEFPVPWTAEIPSEILTGLDLKVWTCLMAYKKILFDQIVIRLTDCPRAEPAQKLFVFRTFCAQ